MALYGAKYVFVNVQRPLAEKWNILLNSFISLDVLYNIVKNSIVKFLAGYELWAKITIDVAHLYIAQKSSCSSKSVENSAMSSSEKLSSSSRGIILSKLRFVFFARGRFKPNFTYSMI